MVSENHGLISPQTIYIMGFLFSAIMLLPFIKKWSVSLSFPTCVVILGGAVIFIFFSLISSYICKSMSSLNVRVTFGRFSTYDNYNQFDIKRWKYYFCILLQIIAIVLLFGHIRSVSSGGSITQILFAYRQYSTENLDDIPFVTSVFRILGLAIGDVFLLIFIYKTITKKFNSGEKILLILGIVFSCILMLLLGARGSVIKLIFTGWLELVALKKAIDDRIPVKFIFATLAIAAFILVSFQFVGRLLGRTAVYNNLDYIGIYTSAPLKNLDTFIKYANNKFFGGLGGTTLKSNQTLISLINYLATRFNIKSLYHTQYTFYDPSRITLGFGYQFVNGHELGNCFTCYDSYISDLGYIGVLIYTSIMAIICQIFYFNAVKGIDKIIKGQISISVIIYAMSFFDIIFSYFSYTFYQNVFHIGTIREVIFAWLIKLFLVQVDVNLRRNYL